MHVMGHDSSLRPDWKDVKYFSSTYKHLTSSLIGNYMIQIVDGVTSVDQEDITDATRPSRNIFIKQSRFFYSFFFCPNVLHQIWIIASYIEGKGVKVKSPSAHNVIIKPLAIDKVVGISR